MNKNINEPILKDDMQNENTISFTDGWEKHLSDKDRAKISKQNNGEFEDLKFTDESGVTYTTTIKRELEPVKIKLSTILYFLFVGILITVLVFDFLVLRDLYRLRDFAPLEKRAITQVIFNILWKVVVAIGIIIALQRRKLS